MNHSIIDLHVHSTESDGTCTPKELVTEAVNAGLAAFALTDHDTFSGVAAAKEAAKGLDLELIPGVELSTSYYGKEIHIVGLFINEADEHFASTLASFRHDRDLRNVQMVEKLAAEGFPITMESLYSMFPDAVVTRAHIARYLYSKGCVKSINEAFEKYIGDNCRFYVPRTMISPMDAVDLIRENGGISILAHPVLYHMNLSKLNEMIYELKSHGLAGIEALYSTYFMGDELQMKKIAKENDLLISGGSDFHGSNKPQIHLGTGKGRLSIPYSVLEDLKAFHAQQIS